MSAPNLTKDRNGKLDQRKKRRKRRHTPTMREVRLLLVRGLYDAIDAASKETKAIEGMGVDPELAKAFAGNQRAFMIFLMGVGIEVMGAHVRGESEKKSLVKPAGVGDLKALEKYGLREVIK